MVLKPINFRITESFSKTDNESAKDGDFSDTGWIDEEGREFSFDADGIERAVEYLKDENVTYHDSWFSTEWEQTGEPNNEDEQHDFFVHCDPEEPFKERVEQVLCALLDIEY
jgi:hypothetical protein